jgi:hypothetical protein
MQYRLYVQFAQTRGVVIHNQLVHRRRRLHPSHSIRAMNADKIVEILARKRSRQIEMQGNLGHWCSGYQVHDINFQRICRSMPIHTSAS